MKAPRRYPMPVRSLAFAAALAVAAQGSGVPMCASLLAEAAAPCAMRTHGAAHAHDFHVATLSPAPLGNGACHAEAAGLGCAASGSCPNGATAAPAWINVPDAPRAASRTDTLRPVSPLTSYLAPPLAPPPQA